MRDKQLEGRREKREQLQEQEQLHQLEVQVHGFAAEAERTNKGIAREAPITATRTYDYAYYKQVFADRRMPFAYLDLNLLDQNICQVVARADDKRVRLASKSLRSVAVIRRILESNPCFQGIMCYTTREAVYLASQGFDDLLVGYHVNAAPCKKKEDGERCSKIKSLL